MNGGMVGQVDAAYGCVVGDLAIEFAELTTVILETAHGISVQCLCLRVIVMSAIATAGARIAGSRPDMSAPETTEKHDYSCAGPAFRHGKIDRSMELMINGETRQFSAPLTVTALVETLGHTGRRIAVERNGEIVPRGRHAEVALVDGDRIEIVVAVGGG